MARPGLDSHRAMEVRVFGIGEGELVIILVFGFLLFGPDKLPQMGRTIGRAMRQFRETQEKMTSVVQSEIIDPVAEAAQAPLKPKKSTDSAADSDDDDEDADSGEAAAAHKETFAERRARLAAEKAAAEGAAEGDAPAADDEDADAEATPAAPADAAAPAADEPAPAAEPEPEPEPEVKTTADLYARRPRKHKAVVEELARELAEEEAEEGADTVTPDTPAEGGDE